MYTKGKNRIYYVTKSFPPEEGGGGSLMRQGAVQLLRQLGHQVTVIRPSLQQDLKSDDIWRINYKSRPWLDRFFERMGAQPDFLSPWVGRAGPLLVSEVKKGDIVFATIGGELAPLELAAWLKARTNCIYVANYRDPVRHTDFLGSRLQDWHRSRDHLEEEFIRSADRVITSTPLQAENVRKKYPQLEGRIAVNYFGYLPHQQFDSNHFSKTEFRKLRLAYCGSISSVQKPERFCQALTDVGLTDAIEIIFFGNAENYAPLRKFRSLIQLHRTLDRPSLLKFLCTEVDLGLVSLSGEYYRGCIPSKIYEYIGVHLPMLGLLPEGDASHLIREQKFGWSFAENQVKQMLKQIEILCRNRELIAQVSRHMKDMCTQFSMENKIKEVDQMITAL